MKKQLYRIAAEAITLALLYVAGLWAMVEWRVMETLLSPGGQQERLYCIVAMAFLTLRIFVVFFAPGWLLSRLYMVFACRTAQDPAKEPGSNALTPAYMTVHGRG